MLGLWITAGVWSTFIGLAAAGVLGWLRSSNRLRTAIVSFALVSVLSGGIGGLSVHHGWNAGIDNLVLRHENWNGWEAKPVAEPRDCRLNGGCVNHYDCNAHKVVDSAAYTDKDGYHAETSHTEWDSCPKYEREVDYTLPTTLYVPVSVAKIGQKTPDVKNVVYNMGEGWVPNGTPEWRGWEAEGHSNSDVHFGIPPAWAAAEARNEAHRPGPVTVRVDYENAILASEYTILQNYSDSVPGYQAAGVLPKVQGAVHDQFLADRAYMMCAGADTAKFQQGVGYLNGDVGQDLQGDLHFVCVDTTKVPAARAENFFGALMAYWKSPAMGLDPLSKNGIVVAVGVDPATQKVAWVRAGTGMPVGNVDMIADFSKNVEDGGLVGANLDAQTLFGSPTATVAWNATKKKFKATAITPGDGLVAKILWGQHKFVRVQMKDFKYLKDEIVPSPSQQHWIVFWAVFWTVVLWVIAFVLSFFVFSEVGGDSYRADRYIRSNRYNGRANRRY